MACRIPLGHSDASTYVQEVYSTVDHSSSHLSIQDLLFHGHEGGHSSSQVIPELLLPYGREEGLSSSQVFLKNLPPCGGERGPSSK